MFFSWAVKDYLPCSGAQQYSLSVVRLERKTFLTVVRWTPTALSSVYHYITRYSRMKTLQMAKLSANGCMEKWSVNMSKWVYGVDSWLVYKLTSAVNVDIWSSKRCTEYSTWCCYGYEWWGIESWLGAEGRNGSNSTLPFKVRSWSVYWGSPGQGKESHPGQGMESHPRQGMESRPGQGMEWRLGQGKESCPGQV